SGAFFWLYVLPLGFILTMYTQTGYDASAHTAEETRGAARAAAQGVWRSVFYSAIAGWAVLLALLFAATNVAAINKGGGGSIPLLATVGLYLASTLPVYLRLRQGSKFQPGPWTLGSKYKWVNIGAIAFVVLVVYALDGPTTVTGAPWNSGFTWTAFNYSPLVL